MQKLNGGEITHTITALISLPTIFYIPRFRYASFATFYKNFWISPNLIVCLDNTLWNHIHRILKTFGPFKAI